MLPDEDILTSNREGTFFSTRSFLMMNIDEMSWIYAERVVAELAWLSYLRGEWLLVTTRGEGVMRRWSDHDLALRDLEQEGWTLTRPATRRLSEDPKARSRRLGYCLKRTIH